MSEYSILEQPELSEWRCYLFGSNTVNPSWLYTPVKGNVPNWFVRYMMKICLGCTWVRVIDIPPEVYNNE